ncbi:hypothetical protein [Paracoccus laeviglucosivorans]|uniref:Uncharacterized protein n=1 Tax=Paracoccus laeviglucosivorans TaxID=1197861 RepID=A0A521ENI4_9RHOB|nr:hypothetical protein [Paracoccus laeviglucosivorans]SMO85486.1 hypothetical protein SAMN06265221_11445 [Paracoccus laeviglucosivorans]
MLRRKNYFLEHRVQIGLLTGDTPTRSRGFPVTPDLPRVGILPKDMIGMGVPFTAMSTFVPLPH